MRANPGRGELDIVVARTGADGQQTDHTYTVKLTMKAAIQVERLMKKPFREVVVAAVRGDYAAIQAVIFMSLQKYHAPEFQTMDQAGELIDDAGGVDAFFGRVMGIFDTGQPQAADEGGVGVADPPDAQAGTSDASKSTDVASV
jgi:hypothetical protein